MFEQSSLECTLYVTTPHVLVSLCTSTPSVPSAYVCVGPSTMNSPPATLGQRSIPDLTG